MAPYDDPRTAQVDDLDAAVKAEQHESDDTLALRVFLEPLQKYMRDPEVSEVCINRPGFVYTEGAGGWKVYDEKLLDYDLLKGLARLIATSVGQRIDNIENLLSATLPEGERVQVVLPPAVPKNTVSITIRTAPPPVNKTLDEYQADGYFDDTFSKTPPLTDAEWGLLELRSDRARFAAAALSAKKHWLTELTETDITLLRLRDDRKWQEFFATAVQQDQNIVISGGTGSGKTTFTRTLINDIDSSERLITIEDTPELALPNHPNHVRLFYSKGDQGLSKTTAQMLIGSCLRMKPDRILMAELRGGESFDYMLGISSGHPGSITTVHANTPAGAFDQLSNYMKRHDDAKAMAREDLVQMLYKTIDIVCQIHKHKVTRKRHMTEVYFEPRCRLSGLAPHAYDFGE